MKLHYFFFKIYPLTESVSNTGIICIYFRQFYGGYRLTWCTKITTYSIQISTTYSIQISTTYSIQISTMHSVQISTTHSVQISTTHSVQISTTHSVQISTMQPIPISPRIPFQYRHIFRTNTTWRFVSISPGILCQCHLAISTNNYLVFHANTSWCSGTIPPDIPDKYHCNNITSHSVRLSPGVLYEYHLTFHSNILCKHKVNKKQI